MGSYRRKSKRRVPGPSKGRGRYCYSCPEGKKRFRTEADALAEKHFINKRKDALEKGLRRIERVYPCELCGGYHLTSKPKKGSTRKVAA